MTLFSRFTFAALLAVWATAAAAQDASVPVHLSLDDALQLASTRNAAVLTAQTDVDAARAGHMRTGAAFLPSLTLSESGVTTNDPLSVFGFKLKQETVTQQDFAPELLTDPDRASNFRTAAEVRQPVFNPEGLYRRKAAGLNVRAADAVLARTGAAVDLQVKQNYFEVVTARRRISVLDSSLVSARANRDLIRDLHEQGLVDRADLLGADVRVLQLEGDLEQARADALGASDRLARLIGFEGPGSIELTTRLDRLSVDVSDLAADSVAVGRSDVRALALTADAARAELRSRRTSFMPRLDVFGGYELNDGAAFGSSGDSWQAGFSLSWRLFSGLDHAGAVRQAGAALDRAEIAVRDAELQAAVEIRTELRNLLAARKRLDFAELAVTQAEEAFRIRSDRFEQGLVRAADLIQAESTLAGQRLALLDAIYQHNLIIYRLEYLTERPLLD